jgi:hypothetical protein
MTRCKIIHLSKRTTHLLTDVPARPLWYTVSGNGAQAAWHTGNLCLSPGVLQGTEVWFASWCQGESGVLTRQRSHEDAPAAPGTGEG